MILYQKKIIEFTRNIPDTNEIEVAKIIFASIMSFDKNSLLVEDMVDVSMLLVLNAKSSGDVVLANADTVVVSTSAFDSNG